MRKTSFRMLNFIIPIHKIVNAYTMHCNLQVVALSCFLRFEHLETLYLKYVLCNPLFSKKAKDSRTNI